MSLDLGGLNWVAIIVGTVVYFLLGAVWFAPQSPIGRAWIAATGYTSPTTGMSAGNAFYIFPALTCLVGVVAVALLSKATGTDSLGEAIVLGLVVGIGIAGAVTISTAAFEFTKPSRWVFGFIDAAYHLVGLTAAAIVLALIR
jgi:hypothetical protein